MEISRFGLTLSNCRIWVVVMASKWLKKQTDIKKSQHKQKVSLVFFFFFFFFFFLLLKMELRMYFVYRYFIHSLTKLNQLP